MIAERILNRLERVKPAGRNQWNARCPAHDDRGPSLAIRERDDGAILLHCFAGCSTTEVIGAMGLQLHELFPTRSAHGRPERRHFANTQTLLAIAFECQIIVCAARTLLDGRTFTGDDRQRMMLAIERISSGLNAAGVAHE